MHATSQKSHPAFYQKPISGKGRKEREGENKMRLEENAEECLEFVGPYNAYRVTC